MLDGCAIGANWEGKEGKGCIVLDLIWHDDDNVPDADDARYDTYRQVLDVVESIITSANEANVPAGAYAVSPLELNANAPTAPVRYPARCRRARDAGARSPRWWAGARGPLRNLLCRRLDVFGTAGACTGAAALDVFPGRRCTLYVTAATKAAACHTLVGRRLAARRALPLVIFLCRGFALVDAGAAAAAATAGAFL